MERKEHWISHISLNWFTIFPLFLVILVILYFSTRTNSATRLVVSAGLGNTAEVERFVNKGTNPNTFVGKNTPLMAALRSSRYEVYATGADVVLSISAMTYVNDAGARITLADVV